MTTYAEVGADAWRWVLAQLEHDADGPWLPETPGGSLVADGRDGYHSGLTGLAHVLSEIRLQRDLTDDEQGLAGAILERLGTAATTQADVTFFDGLTSTVGGLVALGGDPGPALSRMLDLVGADGWPQELVGPPRFTEEAVINDVTLGTGGPLLAALWAGDRTLAHRAADLLLAHAEEDDPDGRGRSWRFVPRQHVVVERSQMPNFSHGTAGMATALAVAGVVLERADLVDAAARGGEYLLAIADPDVDGLAAPLMWPPQPGSDADPVAWGWCHGPAGTSLLFAALELAGAEVTGHPASHWRAECWRAVLGSGIPERRHPGFWDNDGRCCGTAGVGDTALDAWLATGDDRLRQLAVRTGDALVGRAVTDDAGTRWQFVEHRADDPLLPPGTGWFQGAAGIAAYLLRLGRTLEEGRSARSVPRMETWWALPGGLDNLPSPSRPTPRA